MGTDNPSSMKSAIPDGAMAALSSGGNLPFLPEPNIPVVRSGLESIGQSISGLGMNVAQFGLAVAQNKQEIDQREDAVERFRLQNEYELALAEETEKFKVGFQESGEAGELYSQRYQETVAAPITSRFQQLAGTRLKRPESRSQFFATINEGSTRARLGAMKEQLGVRYVQASEKFNDSVDSLTVLADRKAVEGTPEQVKTFLLDKSTETLALYQKLIGPILPQLSPEMQLALQKQLDTTRYNLVEQVINRRFLSGDLAGAEELRRDPELQSLMGSKLPDFTQKFDAKKLASLEKLMTSINKEANQLEDDVVASIVNGQDPAAALARLSQLNAQAQQYGQTLEASTSLQRLSEVQGIYNSFNLGSARSTEEFNRLAVAGRSVIAASGIGTEEKLQLWEKFTSAARSQWEANRSAVKPLQEQLSEGKSQDELVVMSPEDVTQFTTQLSMLAGRGQSKEVLNTWMNLTQKYGLAEYQVLMNQVRKAAGKDGELFAAGLSLLPTDPQKLAQASGQYQKIIDTSLLKPKDQTTLRAAAGFDSTEKMLKFYRDNIPGFTAMFSLGPNATAAEVSSNAAQEELFSYYLTKQLNLGKDAPDKRFLGIGTPPEVDAIRRTFSEFFGTTVIGHNGSSNRNISPLFGQEFARIIPKESGSLTSKVRDLGAQLQEAASFEFRVGEAPIRVDIVKEGLVVPVKPDGTAKFGEREIYQSVDKLLREEVPKRGLGIRGQTVQAQTAPPAQVFDAVQQNIFTIEGGKTYVEKDGASGAPAKYGINWKFQQANLAKVGITTLQQFKNMTEAQAKAVYSLLMAPVQNDITRRGITDPKISMFLADTFYNDHETYYKVMSKFTSPKYQAQMKLSPADEKNIPTLNALYKELQTARIEHLKTLPQWTKSGKGWENQRMPALDKASTKLRQDFYLKTPQFTQASKAAQDSFWSSVRRQGVVLQSNNSKTGAMVMHRTVRGLEPLVDRYGQPYQIFFEVKK